MLTKIYILVKKYKCCKLSDFLLTLWFFSFWFFSCDHPLDQRFRPGLLPFQFIQKLKNVWVVLVDNGLETPVPPFQMVISSRLLRQSSLVYFP